MTQKHFIHKLITIALITTMCIIILLIGTSANSGTITIYTSDLSLGKIFVDGVNTPIIDKNQFDTSISNISINQNGDSYTICFNYGEKSFNIPCEMVSAKSNNLNQDHYLFAPNNYKDAEFDIVNIAFSTSANDYDLVPANLDLVGKYVLTIIMRHIETNDVYYWQTEMYPLLRSPISFEVSNDNDAITLANEFYYMDSKEVIDSLEIDFRSIETKYASEEVYEAYKAKEYGNKQRTLTDDNKTDNNPYFELGIPDDVFKVATEEWQWLEPDAASNGDYLPIRYYAYSYSKFGNPNIMTHIMIVGYKYTVSLSLEDYIAEDGITYSKTSAMLDIELFATPHTVVYYPETNNFDFLLGGEELTQIYEPAVQIYKVSNSIPHVVVGRYEFSNATKNNTLGLGALVLREVVVSVLDIPSYGLASTLLDIGDLVSNPSTSVGASDGYVPIEEYYSNYETQIYRFGYALGGVRSKVKGFLREEGQHLGIRCWFATPYEYRSEVTALLGKFYVSASVR